jgi:hypothetical protein
METIAFVYKWTHIPTLKWYIGSRTSKGCNPDDGYICSSKIVKPMIQSNPTEWKREIIETGTSADMWDLEYEMLELLDAKNDSRSFNQTNGKPTPIFGHKHSEETKKKIQEAHLGKPKKKGTLRSENTKQKMKDSFTLERRLKMSAVHKGIPKSAESNLKNSLSNKGRIVSKETREKNSRKMKGMFSGEKNHKAKLTTEQIINIRKEYDTSNISIVDLVKKYNNIVNSSTMFNIVKRKTWKHIK